jgi:hypothetical protein
MPPANTSTALARPEPRISLAEITDIFATEEVIRLPLGGPHWIDVKRELNYGERTEIESASIRGMQREALTEASQAGNTFLLDLGRQRFLMLALYIVRWSFTEPGTGKPVIIPSDLGERIAFFRNLQGKVGEALRNAVEDHHNKMMAEEAQEEQIAQMEDPRLRPNADEILPPPKPTENGNGVEQTPSPVYANS